MTPADGVLFDFGGTLDADGIHWSPRFHAAYRAAGGSLDRPSFDELFKQSDRALARLPGIRQFGFHDTVAWQARLVLEFVPDGRRIDPNRVAAAFHAEACRTVQRNRPVLERLARRYRLGVLSNFTGNLDPCLRELGLTGLFQVVSDSTLVGATKPDPRIFTESLAALGVPADRAWMVGDNFDADIRPAAQLGMRTCWITAPERGVPPQAREAPTARIARLPDVERILT